MISRRTLSCSFTRATALSAAAALLFSTLAAPWAEAGFWEEHRKTSAQAQQNPPPIDGPRSGLSDLEKALPSAAGGRRLLDGVETLPSAGETGRAPLPAWLSSLSATDGEIRRVRLAARAGAPLVIQVQDVHGRLDAQHRISRMIRDWTAAGRAPLVGLEGAAGGFDLSAYRSADRATTESVAGFLLEHDLIAGAEHAAWTAETPPVLWGVEDPALYRANVRAHADAAPFKAGLREKRRDWIEALSPLKAAAYSPALAAFDKNEALYRDGGLGIGEFTAFLYKTAAPPAGRFPNLDLFRGALRREAVLDFTAVEKDRARLVEALAAALPRAELSSLLEASLLHRNGRLSYARYYEILQDLCRRRGVALSRFPDMADYIEYVTACERIARDKVLPELKTLTAEALKPLLKTEEQRDLRRLTEDVELVRKLADFLMSPDDWREYDAARERIHLLPARLAALARGRGLPAPEAEDLGPALRPGEAFCEAALRRNRAMVDNLLDKMRADRAPAAVLVAGGFHTEGLVDLLEKRGASVVVVSPKIDETAGDGGRYLDFLLDKTPLEQLFPTEKTALAKAVMGGAKNPLAPENGDFGLLVRLLEAAAGTPAPELERGREGGAVHHAVTLPDGHQVHAVSNDGAASSRAAEHALEKLAGPRTAGALGPRFVTLVWTAPTAFARWERLLRQTLGGGAPGPAGIGREKALAIYARIIDADRQSNPPAAFAGAAKLLAALHGGGGAPLYIASAGSPKKIFDGLAREGLAGYFPDGHILFRSIDAKKNAMVLAHERRGGKDGRIVYLGDQKADMEAARSQPGTVALLRQSILDASVRDAWRADYVFQDFSGFAWDPATRTLSFTDALTGEPVEIADVAAVVTDFDGTLFDSQARTTESTGKVAVALAEELLGRPMPPADPLHAELFRIAVDVVNGPGSGQNRETISGLLLDTVTDWHARRTAPPLPLSPLWEKIVSPENVRSPYVYPALVTAETLALGAVIGALTFTLGWDFSRAFSVANLLSFVAAGLTGVTLFVGALHIESYPGATGPKALTTARGLLLVGRDGALLAAIYGAALFLATAVLAAQAGPWLTGAAAAVLGERVAGQVHLSLVRGRMARTPEPSLVRLDAPVVKVPAGVDAFVPAVRDDHLRDSRPALVLLGGAEKGRLPALFAEEKSLSDHAAYALFQRLTSEDPARVWLSSSAAQKQALMEILWDHLSVPERERLHRLILLDAARLHGRGLSALTRAPLDDAGIRRESLALLLDARRQLELTFDNPFTLRALADAYTADRAAVEDSAPAAPARPLTASPARRLARAVFRAARAALGAALGGPRTFELIHLPLERDAAGRARLSPLALDEKGADNLLTEKGLDGLLDGIRAAITAGDSKRLSNFVVTAEGDLRADDIKVFLIDRLAARVPAGIDGGAWRSRVESAVRWNPVAVLEPARYRASDGRLDVEKVARDLAGESAWQKLLWRLLVRLDVRALSAASLDLDGVRDLVRLFLVDILGRAAAVPLDEDADRERYLKIQA